MGTLALCQSNHDDGRRQGSGRSYGRAVVPWSAHENAVSHT